MDPSAASPCWILAAALTFAGCAGEAPSTSAPTDGGTGDASFADAPHGSPDGSSYDPNDGAPVDGGIGSGGHGTDAGPGTSDPTPDPAPTPSSSGPCPPLPAPCRILPMGDSITFGMRATPTGPDSSGGYRRYLRRHLLDDHRVFEYVGACSGFAGRCRVPGGDPPYCFPDHATAVGRHDGHPGWDINAFRFRTGEQCPGSIGTFLSRVTDGTTRVTPDIILLMVGANDVRLAAGIRDGDTTRFRYLLDELLAAVPHHTLIAVGTVTPNLNGQNEREGVVPFNRGVATIVARRIAAGKNVVLVDTHGAIRVDSTGHSPDLSSDHLHPNERGYERIADRWYAAIGGLVHRD